MDKSSSAGQQGVMANLVLSDESLGNRLAVRATYIADNENEPCPRQTNPDHHGLTVSCAGDYTVVYQGCRIYKLEMRRTVQIGTEAWRRTTIGQQSDNKRKKSTAFLLALLGRGAIKQNKNKTEPLVQLRQGLARKVWINHSFADHVAKRVTCWPQAASQAGEESLKPTMAEVGYEGSFQALFQTLLDLVSAFRKAYKDVKTAARKTIELSDQVDSVSTILKSLRQILVLSPEDADQLLTPHVEALAEEVRLALDKVVKDKQRKKSVKGVEVAKALLGRGASTQNKSTEKIRDRIRELMVDLSQAVLTLALKRIAQDYQPTEHRLLFFLDSLDNHDRYHSCWEDVGLMTAASGNKAFSYPTEIQDVGTSENRRGARAGTTIEVLNSTRLRFTISYGGPDNAYFYFIVYDKTSNKAPELFFPSDSKHDNKLERSQQRMFPDRNDYSDDPSSFKVEREDRPDGSTLTRDWVVWVYLIISNQPLHTASTPKIEELELKLAEMVLLLLEKPEDVEFKDTQGLPERQWRGDPNAHDSRSDAGREASDTTKTAPQP